ncbi:MAG: hypothetical protein AAGK21_07065, partial [Bacteroidota bacterium]
MRILLRSLLLLTLVAGTVSAQTETLLTSTNQDPGVLFGSSVAVDGDRLAVGAPQDNRAGVYYIGSVTLFDRTPAGWTETVTIVPQITAVQQFGISVALDGDRLAVGAFTAMTNTGVVYVYDLVAGNWTLSQMISASDGAQGDGFGYAVDLDGSRLVATSAGADQAAGAAYVFDLVGSTWTETVKLSAGTPAPGEMMGLSVALEGSRVVVGAPGPFGQATQSPGQVHVFDEGASSWAETVLTASDASIAARFGESVDIESGLIAVGAPWKSINAGRQGAAYLYELSGTQWSEVRRFDGHQIDIDRFFGYRVALDAGRFAVSEIGAGVSVSRTTVGKVTLFERDGAGWTRTGLVEASDPDESAYFGSALDLDGNRLAVGARQRGPQSQGGAYVYEVEEATTPPPFLAGISASIQRVAALEGDLHSNSIVTLKRQSGNASSYASDVSAVGLLAVERNVTVDGDVTSGNTLTLDPQATVTGTATANGQVPSILLPPAVTVTPGTQNQTAQPGQTRSVAPGAYNRLRANDGGALVLSSGTYDLDKLVVRPGGRVELDVTNGPITINVATQVTVARDAVVETSVNGTPDWTQSDQVRVRSAQTVTLTIGTRSVFTGGIEAPYVTVKLNADATLVGSIAARSINARNRASLYGHGTYSPTPALAPGPAASSTAASGDAAL